eukprot:1892782-Alexandrium_andersonii.AAC.3
MVRSLRGRAAQAPNEARVQFPQGGVRIESDCNADGPRADCGLHVAPSQCKGPRLSTQAT